MEDFKPTLSLINARLKADLVGVSVQERGNRLALVATLPPKPGSSKSRPHQQRVSLGIYASVAGLRQAERLARLLGVELAEKVFSWATWSKINEDPEEVITAGQWVSRFKATLDINETDWRDRFISGSGFKYLDPDQPLTPEALLEAVFRSVPNTAIRVRYCQGLQRLANFAGVTVDLKPHLGSYGHKQIGPRDIPSDDQIKTVIDAIRLPGWRSCFGLIAAYGLRPHEAFYLELEELEEVTVARVTEGKTGSRYPIFPVPQEWVSHWRGELPRLKPNRHRAIGKICTNAWSRLKGDTSWSLYALRHAYAIRCHLKGVPVAVAAQWMGHSPEIHLKTYQRWISEQHHLDTYRKLFLSPKDKV